MKHFFTTVFAVVALLTASNLSAHGEGWYLGASGAANFLTNSDVSQASFTNSSGEAEFDAGYMVSGFLGHAWCSGLALEVEVSYRKNDLDKVTDSGGTAVTVSSGELSNLAIMGNARYCFATDWIFNPYIGAGAGVSRVSTKATAPGVGASLDDDDWVFAYQGIAGMEYYVDEAWTMFLEYRYFRTLDAKVTPTTPPTPGTLKVENASHSVGAGLILHF